MRMSGGHSKASRAAEPPTFPIQEPSAKAPGSFSHHPHPIRNSLPCGCADSVRLRITGTDSPSVQRCDECASLRVAACGCSSPSTTPITIQTAIVFRQQDTVSCSVIQSLIHLRNTALPEPPVATIAILNKVVKSAYRIELSGKCMKK